MTQGLEHFAYEIVTPCYVQERNGGKPRPRWLPSFHPGFKLTAWYAKTDRQSAGTVSSTRSSSGIVYPSSVPSLTLRPMCGRALSCGQSLYPKPWPNAWYNMDPYEMRATRPLRLNRSSYLVGGMSSWDISEYTAQHFQRLYRLFLYLKRRKKIRNLFNDAQQ